MAHCVYHGHNEPVFLSCFGCQEQIMCLLNIHLITVDEGPFLCHEVTFQMPLNKYSSLTYSLTGFSFQVQIDQVKIELFPKESRAAATKSSKKYLQKRLE